MASNTIPPGARGIVARALAGTASPRAAIKAKCLDCSCYDRAEVTHCRVVSCPLRAYRPFQKKAREASKTAPGSENWESVDGAGIGEHPNCAAGEISPTEEAVA